MGKYDYMNESFAKAQEAGGSVPPGEYQAQITDVSIVPTKAGDGERLSWELETVGGDYHGTKLWKSNGLPKKGQEQAKINMSLGFLRHDLKTCGIDVDSPDFKIGEFLDYYLGKLFGRVVAVTVRPQKNNPEYTEVILNELISEGDGEGETAPHPAEEVDVFADE